MANPEKTGAQGFQHEKLDVYAVAVEFSAAAERMARRIKAPHTELADQLRRASFSIALNIAEGAGEFSKPDKRRFYRFALRSTSGCAAIADIGRRLNLLDDDAYAGARTQLIRLTAMLTAICQIRE